MQSGGVWRVVVLTLLGACGPNYRYVYDGESAFERCYANDFDPEMAAPARSRCWQEWLRAYSYGGASDRVEYARSRVTALEAPNPETPVDRAAAPAPTSPAEPPAAPGTTVAERAPPVSATPATPSERNGPSVGEPWRASAPALPSTAPTPTQTPTDGEPPGSACASACRVSWQSAASRCAQRDASCVAHSDEGYRDCMRGCF